MSAADKIPFGKFFGKSSCLLSSLFEPIIDPAILRNLDITLPTKPFLVPKNMAESISASMYLCVCKSLIHSSVHIRRYIPEGFFMILEYDVQSIQETQCLDVHLLKHGQNGRSAQRENFRLWFQQHVLPDKSTGFLSCRFM